MKRAVTVACLAAGLAAPAAAQTSHAPKPAEQCFRSRDYQGFRPLSDKAFVVRANSGRYYQIEVASGCPELKAPNARLITMQHGLDRVCANRPAPRSRPSSLGQQQQSRHNQIGQRHRKPRICVDLGGLRGYGRSRGGIAGESFNRVR